MMVAKRLAVSVVLYFAALSQPINARVILAQELKKEFVDPQLQEARSTAVKVKGGTLVFLAGHIYLTPRMTRPNSSVLLRNVAEYLAYKRYDMSESPMSAIERSTAD
jgi:hypothetical protein